MNRRAYLRVLAAIVVLGSAAVVLPRLRNLQYLSIKGLIKVVSDDGLERRLNKLSSAAQFESAIRSHVADVAGNRFAETAPQLGRSLDWINCAPQSWAGDLKDKVTVLALWNASSAESQQLVRELQTLAGSNPAHLRFVLVHAPKFDEEVRRECVAHAVERLGISLPTASDPSRSIWAALGARGWATVAVVAPDGKILHTLYHQPGEPWTSYSSMVTQLADAAVQHYGLTDDTRPPLTAPALDTSRRLVYPSRVAVDVSGNRLFVLDTGNHRVLVFDLKTRRLQHHIGATSAGFNDGTFDAARFLCPQGMSFSRVDNKLFIADTGNHALREVDFAFGKVRTIVGDGERGFDTTGGVALGSSQRLSIPMDCLAAENSVYIAMPGTHQVWSHDIAQGLTFPLAGVGTREGNLNAPRLDAALLSQPSALAYTAGVLYFADSGTSTVRKIDLRSKSISAVIGGDKLLPYTLYSFGDSEGTSYRGQVQNPQGLALADPSTLYVADTYNHRIKLIDPRANDMVNFVGTRSPGFVDGVGKEAQFNEPCGMAVGGDGRLYVADRNNHAIRLVDCTTKSVSTLRLTFD